MISLKTLFIVVALFFSQTLASEHAKLIVKQHPSYHVYDFENSGDLRLSEFKNLLLAANGFSLKSDIEWKGLKSTNALASPKVTLLFLSDSNNVDLVSGKSLSVDEDTSVNFQYLHNFYDSNNGVVKSYNTLPTEKELKNIECSKEFGFYVFKVSNLKMEDLDDKINSVIEAFNKQCVKDFDDLLVYVLSTTSASQRAKREVREKRALGNIIVNRAIFYSDNYPVAFHLFFWTSLLLGLAVVGTTCGMSQMDPGLNSVIYRMTSQHIKKDN